MRSLLQSMLVLGLVFAMCRPAAAQSDARAILEKAIQAQGGADKLAKTMTMRERSKGTIQEADIPAKIAYTGNAIVEACQRYRGEVEFDLQGMTFTVVEVVDKNKGWAKTNGEETVDLTADAFAAEKEMLYGCLVECLTPLLNDKSFALTVLPEGKVASRPALVVHVVSAGHKDVDLYFDKETGLLVKTAKQTKDSRGGTEVFEETYYSDYREFNPLAADEKVLKDAKQATAGPGLLDFFRKQTLTDADLAKLKTLIKNLGDDSFQVREKASDELTARGAAAWSLLRQATKNDDAEISRRAQLCLDKITSEFGAPITAAAARLLAFQKPEGTAEVLLAYLPFSPDETVASEIRVALALVGMRDGKPDPILVKALEDKDPLRRAAVAAVLGRDGKSPLDQPGRRLYFTGLKLPMKVVVDRAGKRYRETETVELEFYNKFDEKLFAKP